MCEEDPASCKKLTPAEELKAKIKDQYNWDIKGSFTLKELKTIYQTGQDIETYVDGISGGKGQEWMLRMLGNTTIEHGYFDDGHSDAWPFLGNNFESRIRLNENWLNDGWGAKVVFAHELGHIYDINSSFAASYLINLDLGGEGVDLFSPPGSQVPRWASDYHDGYGNSGRNEYFAEAFSATIYDRSNAPTGVAEWIDSKFSNLLYFNPWVRP